MNNVHCSFNSRERAVADAVGLLVLCQGDGHTYLYSLIRLSHIVSRLPAHHPPVPDKDNRRTLF